MINSKLENPEKSFSNIINNHLHDFFFEDRTLILYFGIGSSSKVLEKAWDLWIDCAWRLDDGKKILAAYFDEKQTVNPIMAKLKNSTLIHIDHDNVSHDLMLKFSNGMRLKVFTYSTMDKQWELRGANGYRYGIGPNLSPYEQMESEPNER